MPMLPHTPPAPAGASRLRRLQAFRSAGCGSFFALQFCGHSRAGALEGTDHKIDKLVMPVNVHHFNHGGQRLPKCEVFRERPRVYQGENVICNRFPVGLLG